jgi:hypothetical protein
MKRLSKPRKVAANLSESIQQQYAIGASAAGGLYGGGIRNSSFATLQNSIVCEQPLGRKLLRRGDLEGLQPQQRWHLQFQQHWRSE